MTTSQIAQRLHNSTSRRLSARSIIVHNHCSLLSFLFLFYFWIGFESRLYCFTMLSEIFRPANNGTFAISWLAQKARTAFLRSFQTAFDQSSPIATDLIGVSNEPPSLVYPSLVPVIHLQTSLTNCVYNYRFISYQRCCFKYNKVNDRLRNITE